MDDEAPIDPKATKCSFTLNDDDIEGHRVHSVFNGNPVEPRHSSHRHHHRRRRRSIPTLISPGDSLESEGQSCTPPAQRVQFILGEDIANNDASQTQQTRQISHPLFSEMEELSTTNGDGASASGDLEWRETARWIKFEENVEEGGNRWSKPHVATLSLHALFELRNYLLNGVVLLDLVANTFEEIVARIVEEAIAADMVQRGSSAEQLSESLLKRHRHQHQRSKHYYHHSHHHVLPIIRSFAEIGRNLSSSKRNCLNLFCVKNGNDSASYQRKTTINKYGSYVSVPGTCVDKSQQQPSSVLKKSSSSTSMSHIGETTVGSDPTSSAPLPSTPQHNNNLQQQPYQHNIHFMKKVPVGAEASNILVGEVDFLERTCAIFLRLNRSALLGDLTEVPVPTRFIFVLMGPPTASSAYHEVGRAMATLMSDEIFHEVAYRARNRQHLLAGIDEFLDAVTVLPPGEWDPTIRIEPPAAVPSQEPRLRHATSTTSGGAEDGNHNKREKSSPSPPPAPPSPPPTHTDEDISGLQRTGRLFGGLIADVRRKAPFYLSDFRDCLAMQCIASWIFLYFACLSPIITFGGLLADATGRNMAAMESLVSGFVCGMGYGLFSGQPLTILGSTGPVLVFETIVYDFCRQMEWDYLPFRLWIGTWMVVILVVLVAVDASALVCYITRFTEENFATLIAFIFIYKAVENVLIIGKRYPIAAALNPNATFADGCSCLISDQMKSKFSLSEMNSDGFGLNASSCQMFNGSLSGADCFNGPQAAPNVFLMSILLFLGTFLISVQLKDFKNALFFTSKVRQFISDFAVIIAILSMTLLDYQSGIATPKLEVPHEFKPTTGRSWLVPPFNGNPIYTVFVAIPPALLGTILVFMDQQITSVIINRKENKLKKRCGYHLDLFVLAILIQICSLLGLPWFVAATVLSINHVNSLKLESECTAPGEKPHFLGVREQRVTHILIFATIGLSVFLTPMLGHIPMPVLYGVFLYMGCASLKGLQFFDRILIMFMPVKYQPDLMFLRQVPIRRVHLFTIIQLTCLACLWLIKSFSTTSILFPLMLVVMIGIRKCLDCVFTRRELEILDDVMPETTKKHVIENSTVSGSGANSDDGMNKAQSAGATSSSEKEILGEIKIGTPTLMLNGTVIANKTNKPLGHTAINITEEMTKTSIWKQLRKGKDTKRMINNQWKKVRYSISSSMNQEDANTDNTESNKPATVVVTNEIVLKSSPNKDNDVIAIKITSFDTADSKNRAAIPV